MIRCSIRIPDGIFVPGERFCAEKKLPELSATRELVKLCGVFYPVIWALELSVVPDGSTACSYQERGSEQNKAPGA